MRGKIAAGLLMFSTASLSLPQIQFSSDERDTSRVDLLKDLSEGEFQCYTKKQVLYDGGCHNILSSAPCKPGDWLVMEVSGGELTPSCQPRPCPAQDQTQSSVDCKCYEDSSDICGENEELFVNIFGLGACQCAEYSALSDTDNSCYPVHHRGPCQEGEVFVVGEEGLGVCSTTPCTEGQLEILTDVAENSTTVTFSSGENGTALYRCYAAGEKGPCSGKLVVGVEPGSLGVGCVEPSITTRIFDLIPGGFGDDQEDGGIRTLRLTPSNCFPDRIGRCRRPLRLQSRRRSRRDIDEAHGFASWLNAFKAVTSHCRME